MRCHFSRICIALAAFAVLFPPSLGVVLSDRTVKRSHFLRKNLRKNRNRIVNKASFEGRVSHVEMVDPLLDKARTQEDDLEKLRQLLRESSSALSDGYSLGAAGNAMLATHGDGNNSDKKGPKNNNSNNNNNNNINNSTGVSQNQDTKPILTPPEKMIEEAKRGEMAEKGSLPEVALAKIIASQGGRDINGDDIGEKRKKVASTLTASEAKSEIASMENTSSKNDISKYRKDKRNKKEARRVWRNSLLPEVRRPIPEPNLVPTGSNPLRHDSQRIHVGTTLGIDVVASQARRRYAPSDDGFNSNGPDDRNHNNNENEADNNENRLHSIVPEGRLASNLNRLVPSNSESNNNNRNDATVDVSSRKLGQKGKEAKNSNINKKNTQKSNGSDYILPPATVFFPPHPPMPVIPSY